MRFWGWAFIAAGVALVALSLNADMIELSRAGTVQDMNRAQATFDQLYLGVMAGFSIVTGAVLLGAAHVSAALRGLSKPHSDQGIAE